VERIEKDVRGELARFGPPGGMPEVLEAWPDAVGDVVAANAWPARIARDGTLHVNTSSSAWAFELSQLAPMISERLGEKLGENAPNSLRFAVGHLPESAADGPPETGSSPLEPTPEALQTAANLTAEIADEELRERISKAAALSLSQARSDRPF
jgi:hypothetical protein